MSSWYEMNPDPDDLPGRAELAADEHDGRMPPRPEVVHSCRRCGRPHFLTQVREGEEPCRCPLPPETAALFARVFGGGR